MTKRYILNMGLLLVCLLANAQQFFNLTADEVRIDSMLPTFLHQFALGYGYADSVYTVTIEYPEFISMSAADASRCHDILAGGMLPELPAVEQSFSVVRKRGLLEVSLCPIVWRDGQYQKLVSFMLRVKSEPRYADGHAAHRRAGGERYAANSVLSKGTWVKIRVPATGIYQLTSELTRQAGFSDFSKVKVYGYGGARQPELLTDSYLTETDDLTEVPTCNVDGRRLFYAVGPVTWDSSHRRIRNPYSDYGYYFLTESDDTPLTVDSETFINSCYPRGDDNNTLYEVDDFAWYQGGRNLYDAREINGGSSRSYTVAATGSGQGMLTVALTAAGTSDVTVSLNDSVVGLVNITLGNSEHEAMGEATLTCNVSNLQASNTVTVATSNSSLTTRLDYIAIHANQTKPAPDLGTASFPVPQYVCHITNQNHHADTAADMVIIIPTSLKLLKQAERLKALHELYDSLRVNIVPADELYNEFSSGTPDANAYRRYLKMLYDRAEREADMPRFLLLLGDGVWDNRLLTAELSGNSVDDLLLCYESENSYSHTDCYVTDDYFCLLDDGEGSNLISRDKADVAVGRITARTSDEAAIAVDKIESYLSGNEAGIWQNTLCFMGDDGNQDKHMVDADAAATLSETLNADLLVKRIMWDAYTRVSSATGNSYPDATRLIKQQMQHGALIMNYSGHGRADAISHEYVLRLSDFGVSTSMRLPLWVTASCDIMPFDGTEDNIGETTFFNQRGGAIAFYGTTRTVFQQQNKLMNMAFTRRVLSRDDSGRSLPIGEAVRLAKIDLLTSDPSPNKLQYSLLGDPAIRLALPTADIVLDSINGTSLSSGQQLTLRAGATATIKGRVLTAAGTTDTSFDGIVTAVVHDARQLITCKQNNTAEAADEPFTFYDRPNTIYNGSDSVRQGQFSIVFVVPKDISYSDDNALINLFAVNRQKTVTAGGHCDQLVLNGTASTASDQQGPSIYCYLNSSSFTNGDNVNSTPYFFAELADEDGINATGSGIGHDLQLIIDGEMAKTYSLNDYFQYDFGSYTRGSVGYSIPALDYGPHTLLFRAWDVMNNPSTTQLTFNVVKSQQPQFIDMDCTPNPASEKTTFRIVHDREGSALDVVLDVFDMSGRHLWSHSETDVNTSGNLLAIDWDLTVDGGRRLATGVYLYRLRLSSEGSSYASKAQKLIILTHQ